MSFIFAYLIKLSVSLGIMYLFYQFFLRKLTFYNWNRGYLFMYSFFSFLIPLINITPALERNAVNENTFVQFVPTFYQVTTPANHISVVERTASSSWNINDWVLFVVMFGMSVMLIRLFIQFISFRLMLKQAKLISNDSVKIYQLNKKITPFSFGNSIFINQSMHDENEMREIIRHEYVHIKQRHTVDILWAELLCIVNWYNPFAWLIRNAIKQNLEFIADNKVIETGMDKKTYQYLLLKVLGNNYYAITMPFNFSSLKKRITMMNKFKQTKVHLLKFLFLIPIIIVLLLSFRGRDGSIDDIKIFTVAGLIFDNETMQPVADVYIADSISGSKSITDKLGYYELKIPVKKNEPLNIRFWYQRPGSKMVTNCGGMQTPSPVASSNDIVLFGIVNKKEKGKGPGLYAWGAAKRDGETVVPNYGIVLEKFKLLLQSKSTDSIIAESSKPIQFINGIPYACSISGKAWFSKDELDGSPECKVWVDGKVLSIEETNAKYTRFQFNGVGAMPRVNAKEKLNIDCNVLVLFKEERPSFLDNGNNVDTTKKPITYIKRKDTISPKLNSQERDIVIDATYISADSFSWKSDTLRFKGDVDVKVIEKGKDMLMVKVNDLYIGANKAMYVLLNGNPYKYNNHYYARSGEKFKLVTFLPAQAIKKYGDKASAGAIEINTIEDFN